MSKCGKGCMPECEYFTTGGCISPFNCPYKIEVAYNNSATTIPYTTTEEYYRNTIKQSQSKQKLMNTANPIALALKGYIDYLEAKNANLEEQLKKLKGENKQ